MTTLNPHDDIHAETLAHYQKTTERLLAIANKKAEGISEMLEQLDGLITPEHEHLRVMTYWIFIDSRGKPTHVRDGQKPISNPMSRRGRWVEVTPL
jgi:hypothetical protein